MRLWYNDVGQLRLTQDPDQRNSGTYSFSRYDRQGRITATGVVAGAAVGPNSTREPEFPSATNSALTETIRTVYDVPQPSSCAAVAQEHLRGRVSALIVEPIEGVTSVSSCYSYDQHGNVRTFVQNIAGLGPKRLDYEYDLATGNVGELRYQQGATDQTLFRFDYDAGNRLTAAYSSMDGELWDRDARIQYYRHGPMARMELGQTVIQGIDYVYTLQGWLKGVNANTLQTSRDPGRDGDTTVVGNPRRSVPADAFGFSLSYHPGDYKSTGASAVQFEAQTGGSGLEAAGPGLFDGNIAHSVSANDASLASGASPLGVAYRHDQINRLDSARVFSNTNTIANSWSPSGRSDDFLMAVRYDANGNIAGVVRNAGAGTATQIDSLTYHYSGSNRLSHIDDSVAATTNSSDLGDQRPLNYDYSRRGEVKADSAAGLRIQWTMNGQVSEIEKADGSHLEFRYDGNRQRIEKILKPSTSPSTWQYRYYVRDPHGNPLATYLQRQLSDGGSVTTETTLEDIVISAENRIGILRRDLVLHTGVSPNPGPFIRRTGARRYELVDNLGSVRVLIADRRKGLDANADGQVDTYGTLRLATFDYYPFGLSVPGRFDDTLSYRYGFDGAERDDEIAGQGRVYDFGARMYDASVGRFLSIDPLGKDHPEYSPYLFAGNKPIWATDAFGMEECTGTSCDPVSTVASGPDAGAADKRDWVNTAPPGFVEGKDYTPAEVAQVFKGAPYDPDYPHPVGFKAKNYARSSGCLMSGYLVCSPYVNAAATLWLTGRLETDELANGNLPPSSAYFQRGLSGQALVEGLINKGATENVRELLLNAPARFEKNFRELDIDHSNFVVLIKRPMLAADPTHVAFAYWQPGSGRSGGQWMVSEANQRAGEVINHSLHDFSRHLAKTNVIEVRALSK
jgi:RHS repeat-associated protein